MNNQSLEQLADRLLLLLRAETGKRFRLDAVAAELQAGPADIERAAGQLTEWGYTLSTSPTELRLLGTPDVLSAAEIGYGLDTSLIGRRILPYREVKSTNDIAAREGEAGAADGTVVIADRQTQGRGRFGRVWHSPSDAGAYISIILRPSFPPLKAPGLSLMAALALAETIEDYCPKKVKIKWPNDVLLDGRKTAGILTELSADRETINYIVVGIGININHEAHDFPDELAALATSVRIAGGAPVERVPLVRRFLQRFDSEYRMYRQHFLKLSLPRLRYYSSLLGHTIRLAAGGGIIEGTAIDIADDGSLIIEKDGRRRMVSSGEVTVVKSHYPDR